MKDIFSSFIEEHGYRNLAFLTYVFLLFYPMDVTSSVLAIYVLLFIFERPKSTLTRYSFWKAYSFGAIPGLIALSAFIIFGFEYYGLKEVEKNITFFLLPFLCLVDYESIRKLKTQVFTALFLGILSLEVVSLFIFLVTNDTKTFYEYLLLNYNREYLSDYVALHHVYFSLGIAIGLLGVIYYRSKIKINPILLNGLIVLSFIYNLMLFARAPLFIFLVLLIIVMLKNKHLKMFLVLLVLSSALLTIFNKESYNFQRLLINSENSDVANRIKLNRVSWEIFKSSPFFGVGPDRIRYERLDGYRKIGHTSAYKYTYNSHNQYFNYLSVNGLLGFSVFIFMVLYSLYILMKNRQWLLLLCFLLFYLSCLSESYLSRNKGIVIFSLLTVLFLTNNISVFQKNGERNKKNLADK